MAIAEIARTADTASAWARELEAWRDIPAHSPVWDDVEAFIDGLRDIASAKRVEREAGRDALRTALSELCQEFADDLEYFEVRARFWSADAVPREEAMAVATRIGELHAELKSRRILQAHPAEHYAEARRLRAEISAAEDTIFDHLEALAKGFSGADAAGIDVEERRVPAVVSDVAKPVAVVQDESSNGVDSHSNTVTVEPPPVSEATPQDDDLHRLIDPEHGKYSPLTREQERVILADGPGVGIAFASGALGFEHVPEAVSHLVASTFGSRAAYDKAAPSIAEDPQVHDWLKRFSESHSGCERLFAVQPVAMPSEAITSRVEGALRLVDARPAPPLRMLFIMAPAAVGGWLALAQETAEQIEGRLTFQFTLRPWTFGAIQDRLERQGKRYDPVVTQLILDATGGWSWCLDKLFELAQGDADPRKHVEEITRRLMPGGELHDEFLMRTGVRPDTLPHRVLQLLAAEGEVPTDLLTPEFVGGDAPPEDCQAALAFLQAMSCAEVSDGVVRPNPYLSRIVGKA